MRSYQELLRDVLANGEKHEDRTGVGTVSVFGRQWRHNMQDGFPLLTTKRVPFRWVAEELFWFLSGSTNEQDLRDKGVDIWKEWATEEQCAKFGREEGDLGPVYGALWRRFPGAEDREDQIRSLMQDLEENANSRRLIVTGWHPKASRQVALPPCHTLYQLKAHGDTELSLQLYARSIDIFLGLPFNIASYALLLELIARCVNRKPRELIITFGDLHLYSNHIEQARLQLSREPYDLPRLSIRSEHVSDMVFSFCRLMSLQWPDIELTGYKCHPKIEAEVAV